MNIDKNRCACLRFVPREGWFAVRFVLCAMVSKCINSVSVCGSVRRCCCVCLSPSWNIEVYWFIHCTAKLFHVSTHYDGCLSVVS